MENAKPNKALRIIAAVLFLLVALTELILFTTTWTGRIPFIDRDLIFNFLTQSSLWKYLSIIKIASPIGVLLIPIKGLIFFITAVCLFRDKSKGALDALITVSYTQSISCLIYMFFGHEYRDILGVVFNLLLIVNAIILTVCRKKNAILANIIVSVFIIAISVYILKVYAVFYLLCIIATTLAVMYRKSVLDYEREHPELFEPAAPAAAPAPVVNSTIGNADTLKKYKELLDEGIITQEEYDTKKKELLNL